MDKEGGRLQEPIIAKNCRKTVQYILLLGLLCSEIHFSVVTRVGLFSRCHFYNIHVGLMLHVRVTLHLYGLCPCQKIFFISTRYQRVIRMIIIKTFEISGIQIKNYTLI